MTCVSRYKAIAGRQAEDDALHALSAVDGPRRDRIGEDHTVVGLGRMGDMGLYPRFHYAASGSFLADDFIGADFHRLSLSVGLSSWFRFPVQVLGTWEPAGTTLGTCLRNPW